MLPMDTHYPEEWGPVMLCLQSVFWVLPYFMFGFFNINRSHWSFNGWWCFFGSKTLLCFFTNTYFLKHLCGGCRCLSFLCFCNQTSSPLKFNHVIWDYLALFFRVWSYFLIGSLNLYGSDAFSFQCIFVVSFSVSAPISFLTLEFFSHKFFYFSMFVRVCTWALYLALFLGPILFFLVPP